ncbi:MAG: ABC transporter substrate-binding protein [Spirochaetaceae bacterium]|jgi:NitT/TauT family transport system substrate-binding protein|nr:ABC transporter substrate-binding protein [Spirochaetaceae bacterium]
MVKRTIICWALLASIAGLGFASGKKTAEPAPLTIYGLKGPSGVGMIRLFETPPEVRGMRVSVEALASGDLMAARFISGEAKVGILPSNVAAKIAASGKPVQLAAVTGLGMLSLLSGDPSVRTIADLRGRKIAVAGQGAVPDYVFRKILTTYQINPGTDVTLDYSLAYPEIAQSLIAGRIDLAIIPEPFATMARQGNGSLAQVSDIQAEWEKAGGQGNYPITVLVVDTQFAKENRDGMKTILAAVKDSIEWVKANPVEAGALVEKHGLGLRAPVVAASVPRSNFAFIDAKAARPTLTALYETLLEFAPDSIGGRLPDDSFYY